MTRNDLLMIKGVRRVVEWGCLYRVTLYVSWWWLWSKKRRVRLERTLDNRMAVPFEWELRVWWW